MARDVFIVACLELGLHPDLSQVRWNLGTIDLSHFGLGDRLAGALAVRYQPLYCSSWARGLFSRNNSPKTPVRLSSQEGGQALFLFSWTGGRPVCVSS